MLLMTVITSTNCDLVHNMCGWFIQFTSSSGTVHRTGLGTVTEDQALSRAHDLGFDEMAIWDFERHVKDVCIPKGNYGNTNGSNGHH